MASSMTGVRVSAFLAVALALPVPSFVARAEGEAPEVGGRKPFAGARTPEERHPLLDAWKARQGQQPSSRAALGASATGPSTLGLGGTPIVGRASMVINASNTVVYTKNFIGSANNCEVDMGYPNDWQATTAFVAGDHIRSSNNFMATNSGTSGAVAPVFNQTFGATTTDGTITWVCTGSNWGASRAYTAGMTVRTSFGYVGFNYQATTSGTSGATEPFWPTTVGGTVIDNGVVWKAIGYFPGSFRNCNPMQARLPGLRRRRNGDRLRG